MKTEKLHKDLELLSAYVDGELSENEAREVEQKIKLSEKLNKQVEEIRELKKLTSSSFTKIPESPFFETKLIAEIVRSKKPSVKFRKWSPIAAISVLTIALMFVLKLNPGLFQKFVEDQKSNIAGFYTENLKPLLFAANLNNEDIFNFAFYNRLPLDKTNQKYLSLGYEPNGKEYFEIKKTSDLNSNENTLAKFTSALKLSDEQKDAMDSILETYADDLQGQVLVNENNTVAINPNLWNYNKAILADLLSFAEHVNKKELSKIVPAKFSYDRSSVKNMVRTVKASNNSEYIFLTPDTIFYESYTFDKDKFRKEMAQMKEEMKKGLAEVQKEFKNVNFEVKLDSNFAKLKKNITKNQNFNIWLDSNTCKINLSQIQIPKINLPDFDSLGEHLGEITKHLKSFSFNFPKNGQINGHYHFKVDFGDSSNSVDLNFNAPNADSLAKIEKFFSDSLGHKFNKNFFKRFKNFNFNPDSLASMFNFFDDDSVMVIDRDMFRKQMEGIQKQMERFQEQMQKLQENIQKNTPEQPKGKKKSIEI